MKYEFDNFEEYDEAWKHLEDYHDCEQCRGKIVFIGIDKLGNQICGYCKQIVRYPHMTKEAFEKWMVDELQKEESK